MNSLCFDGNKEGDIEMKSAEGEEGFPASDLSGLDDTFGDPEVPPRVGDEFQVEIPSFVASPCRSQLTKSTCGSEITVNSPEPFSIGLPIPLMWAHCKIESSFVNESPNVKLELRSTLLGEGKNVGGFSNFQSSLKFAVADIDSYRELKAELYKRRGMCLLPGSSADQSWTDIEYNSFLLSLYTFGKNLTLLKRFVGSKKMEDILSFYYGKFYRSKGYSRWSECRKMRTKRYVYRQKIFTGWRQQELLSRLFPHISGECRTLLIEISRKFAEGKMPFEEYIFALKNAVGIELLINAVGIGKGKQDLTGNAVEPTKTNHLFSARSEIPVGKACSSLAPAEIIKFLTGNFRLSKARSSDLFWEAVWPRLLAKGWHSEQPKDQVVSGSKQSLVFLIPGVKKFSRRKLVKGNHYFDSLSDVLNKVALDPGLLESENQATEGNVDKENRQDKCEIDSLSCPQQPRYLQPISSKSDEELMKFTIVDTSMVHGLDRRKVRQLRIAPFDTMSISTISGSSTESEKDTSDESEDEVVELANPSKPVADHVEHPDSSNLVDDQVEQAHSSNPVEEFSDKGVSIDSSDCTLMPEALDTTMVEVDNHRLRSDLNNDDDLREINEHQFIQKETSNCSNYFPYITKMPKLTACSHREFSHHTENNSVDRKFDLNEPISPMNLHEASEGVVLYGASEVLSFPPSNSNMAKGSPNTSNEGSATENHLVGEVSAERPETRILIDLNFPQVSPELGMDMEIPSSSMVMLQDLNENVNTSTSPSEITTQVIREDSPDHHKEQQYVAVNRRQSTRNRPLTTKALEALEYSFLNSKRKRKNTEPLDNNSKSQCLRAGNGAVVGASCDNGIENSMADTRPEEENVLQAA